MLSPLSSSPIHSPTKRRSFRSAQAVYNHVCKFHLLSEGPASGSLLCLWSTCNDRLRRQKWSLVNHLQERHCTENALRAAIVARKQGLILSSSSANTAPVVTNPNLIKEAAMFAIQRHQTKRIEDFIVRGVNSLL